MLGKIFVALLFFVIIVGILYHTGVFLFHLGPDFSLGVIAFWIGFYYDVLKKDKSESDNTLAKVAYGICALCFVRGFWGK